ncbi:ribose 5-phosphate isomerase A [Nematocida sp. AWRm80]|nr:ribose 5-phosphate isomerase A [Nematocida sp. AWRm80]
MEYKRVIREYYHQESVIGIGTGRTAEYLLREIVQRTMNKINVISTSKRTNSILEKNKEVFSRVEVKDTSQIEVYFDGADYLDGSGNLVKGYGGAITQERMCMFISQRNVIVLQKNKVVSSLNGIYIPVEILPCAERLFIEAISGYKLDYKFKLDNSSKYVTDLGNLIVYVEYRMDIEEIVKKVPGVISVGLLKKGPKDTIVIVDDILPVNIPELERRKGRVHKDSNGLGNKRKKEYRASGKRVSLDNSEKRKIR